MLQVARESKIAIENRRVADDLKRGRLPFLVNPITKKPERRQNATGPRRAGSVLSGYIKYLSR
jgi:hypothetical protein